MNTKIVTAVLLALVLLPSSAAAYTSPESYLTSRETFLPPTPRDAAERTNDQFSESQARREREQERAFALQNPVMHDEPEEAVHAAAPQMQVPTGNVVYAIPVQGMATGFPQLFGAAPAQPNIDSANLELARTMRLLSRVNQHQATAQFEQQILHSGADDLAPTGAGSLLAMLTMLAAVGYTLWRAQKSSEAVGVLS